MFRITNYWALILLLSFLPIFYYSWKSLNVLSPLRRNLSLGLRAVILLILILALAGLQAWKRTERLSLFYVLDVSASVDAQRVREALAFIKSESEKAGPDDRVGLIVFGRDASVEIPLMPARNMKSLSLERVNSAPGRDYTDIAAALRLAVANIASDSAGRILLLSDGNENLGSARDEAKILASRLIEVYTRPMEKTFKPDVLVDNLHLPAELKVGEPFELSVSVSSNINAEGKLKIFRNDAFLGEKRVRLEKDKRNAFVLPQRLERSGFYNFRAEVEVADDAVAENNFGQGFTFVAGKPKVLYWSESPKKAGSLLSVLPQSDYDLDRIDARNLPETLAAFQDYDLVIFDNASALRLSEQQMKLIQSYVRDLGGGFLMIGGENSFGPGGYYKTPIEDVLPVSLDVRRKKHFPDLALVLVLDKSGSMAGYGSVDKMRIAKESAIQAVDLLSERDRVGVIAFDEAAKEVIGLTGLQNKQEVINAIGTIRAGGGTSMYPAMAMAYDWLRRTDTQVKHMIVLSDGRSEPGDFYGLTSQIAKDKITVSMVAVGEDADFVLMKSLAELGGGRYYASDNVGDLPRIFTKEAFLASRATILEEPFVPKLAEDHQLIRGIDWPSAPQLLGYVGTTHKPLAGTPLVSHYGDPILAGWQYGLGRSLAFTSDAHGRWATHWLAWRDYGKFWNQALRWTARQASNEFLIPHTEVEHERARLVVDAVSASGDYRNNLSIEARVVQPDLQTKSLPLKQTAPGRYEADFEVKGSGAYLISLNESLGGGKVYSRVTGLVHSYSPEFKNQDVNSELLKNLVAITDGKWYSASTDLFEPTSARNRVPQDLWQLLLWLAALLFPLDVAVRRLYFTRDQFAFAYNKLAARKKPQSLPEPIPEIQALKRVKLKPTRENKSITPEPIMAETQSRPSSNDPKEAKEPDTSSTRPTKVLLEVKRKAKK